ncbi:hypothetical protein I4U23_022154 [Adineta vaga]|nr:hypothetical protein I4U23_022154 [Adineta vaga]
MINLSNIQHLHLDGVLERKSPNIFKEIFKSVTQLSSLQVIWSDLILLKRIKHLPKLTYIEIRGNSDGYRICWIREEVEKHGLHITADFDNDNKPFSLFIWINRN